MMLRGCSAGCWAVAVDQKAMMAEFKYQYGRLSYRRRSTGAERGREDWWLTRNRDGTVTMRSLSMMDDSKLVRDVVYTRAKDGRPIDVFIRLQADDRMIGAGYFRVQGETMDVVADGVETGHSIQSVKVPPDFFSITTHSVMLDAWAYFNYDRAKGGEQLRTFYNTTSRLDAADGPLGRIETYRVTFNGEEEADVPAGKFKATHFRVKPELLKTPAAHFWVAGEDKILLHCEYEDLDLVCVLTSWTVEQLKT
jgi:hypothetical protein